MIDKQNLSEVLEALRDARNLITASLPDFLSAWQDNRVPNLRITNLLVKNLEIFSEYAGWICAEAEASGQTLSGGKLDDLTAWINRRMVIKELAAFLQLETEDEATMKLLKVHQQRVMRLAGSGITDPEDQLFAQAVKLFVSMVRDPDLDVPDKEMDLLDDSFERQICRRLYKGEFRLLEEAQEAPGEPEPAPVPEPKPEPEPEPKPEPASKPEPEPVPVPEPKPEPGPAPAPAPEPVQVDKKPLRWLEDLMVSQNAQWEPVPDREFQGLMFRQLMRSIQPARRVLMALARYYVLSLDQLRELVANDFSKTVDGIQRLLELGYIEKCKYVTEENEPLLIYMLGRVFTAKSNAGLIREELKIPNFDHTKTGTILKAARENAAALWNAVRRSEFVIRCEKISADLRFNYPGALMQMGAVAVRADRTVWFLGSHMTVEDSQAQSAHLKQVLQMRTEDEQIVLWCDDDSQPGDCNVAILNAKLGAQVGRISYMTPDGLYRAAGLEKIGLSELLFDPPQTPEPEPEDPETEPDAGAPGEEPGAEAPAQTLSEEPAQEVPAAELPEIPEEEAPAMQLPEEPAEEAPAPEFPEEAEEEIPAPEPDSEEPDAIPSDAPAVLNEGSILHRVEATTKASAWSDPAAGKSGKSQKRSGEPEPKRSVMDRSKLPVIPVRNVQITSKNGIFRGIDDPGQQGIHTMFTLAQQGNAAAALLYAKALTRCDSEYWEPVYQMLAYAYDDPMANCDYDYSKVQNAFCDPFPGTTLEVTRRFELSACLRLLATEKLDMTSYHLYQIETFRNLFSDCGLFRAADKLGSLMQAQCEFIQRYRHGLGAETSRKVNNACQSEVYRDALQKRAQDLLEMRLDDCAARHNRVKALRTALFGPSGVMTTLLRPVAQGNTRDLAEGKKFIAQFTTHDGEKTVVSEHALNEYIDKIWVKVAYTSAYNRNESLKNNQKIPIRKNMTEFIQVFLQWENLTCSSDYRLESIVQTRGRLLSLLEKSIPQVEAVTAGSVAERAGQMAVLGALREIQAMLAGDPVNRDHFYMDYVTSAEVELDTQTGMPVLDESVSIIPGCELWNRVVRHESCKLPMDQYITQVIRGTAPMDFNFGRSLLLLRYLTELKKLPENITLQEVHMREDAVLEDINSMQSWVQKVEREFQAEMELNEGYGRFAEFGMKDRILHEFWDWYRPFAEYSSNFGFFKRKADACCKAVEMDAEAQEESYRQKLAALRLKMGVDTAPRQKGNILDTIDSLISKRIYSVADDYMNLAEKGYTVVPGGFMSTDNSADYFALFLQKFKSLFRSYGCDASRPLIEVYTDYHPESQDLNKTLKAARSMLCCWPQWDQRETRDRDLREFLFEMGFDVRSVRSLPEHRGLKEATFGPSVNEATDYEHPFAAFGSSLSTQGMTLQLIFGRSDRETIMNAIRSHGSTGNPVMILLDYSLTLQERRAIAATLKREGSNTRTVVLIDRIMAVYLAQIPREQRIKAMLQCTLPFLKLIPYYTSSTAEIPPEMFMGRRDELNEITRVGGTQIIYGGRQLGKTALLQRARVQFDKRNTADEWGIYISVLNKSYDVLPAFLCRELGKAEHFLAEDAKAETWEELCDLIRDRMDPFNHPKTRLLLLLDEADVFLFSCEADQRDVVGDLLRLQQNTGDRFKFVLAGLHNVVRYSKRSLDNNNNLARLSPLCVKPLKYSEASELLEKPLFYLGFRMKDEHTGLVSQILSSCNYYPGLIHYYAYQLLNKMELNTSTDTEVPPYYLDENQIRNLLQDHSFNEQIKDKLFATLRVDVSEGNYYYILAYALAYRFHEDNEAASFGFTAAELMHICADFSIASVVNLGEHTVHSLLLEMVELNVLRTSDQEHFTFNRRSFLEMLGNADVVFKELEGFADEQ